MTDARKVILEYLNHHKTPPGSKLSRDAIASWCFNQQSKFGVYHLKSEYLIQIDKMIFRTENNKESHPEDFENVFCPSSVGQSFVVTYYEPRS